MRLRRSLRFLLVPIVILAVLVVLGPLLIPQAALRDLVVTRLEESLGRDVTVGAVRARLLPRPRVALKDLAECNRFPESN